MSPDWTEMRQLDGRGLLLDTQELRTGWIQEYIQPDDQQHFMAAIQEALASGSSFNLEHRVRLADGGLGLVHSRAVPIIGPNDEIAEWFGAATDVTARKMAEQRLRESEAQFRLMADAVPQIVWITDAQGWTEFFNCQWLDYTGAPSKSSNAAEVAMTMGAFEEARRTGCTLKVEHRILSKWGDYRWFLVRGEPYRDPDTGEIQRWYGASIDIHDRQAAEAKLRGSEERLRLATEAAEVGFWDVDEIDQVLHWPPLVKAMFGMSADVRVTIADFYHGLHPEDRGRTSEVYAAAADSARRAHYDVEYRTIGKEDGVIRWVAAKGRGVFDEIGRCVRVIGTAIDITARKAIEQQLRELNETLESRVAARTVELAENERRFRAIFNSTYQLTGLSTLDGMFLVVNRQHSTRHEPRMSRSPERSSGRLPGGRRHPSTPNGREMVWPASHAANSCGTNPPSTCQAAFACSTFR